MFVGLAMYPRKGAESGSSTLEVMLGPQSRFLRSGPFLSMSAKELVARKKASLRTAIAAMRA
jgi:hypothetical protein